MLAGTAERRASVLSEALVGHSFSQTVCGNLFDEFLDDFLVDFLFTLPCTRPESFLPGRIACKLKNRSQPLAQASLGRAAS